MQKLVKATFLACVLVIGAASHPAFAAPLDDAALKTMITNLGYTVTDTSANGTTTHWITATLADNSYNIQMYFQLSSDKRNLWIIASLFAIPKGKSIPEQALLGMMIENDTIAPKSFSLGKSNNTLYLNSMVVNDGVTPALLRQTVDSMTTILGRTEQDWAPEKWPASAH